MDASNSLEEGNCPRRMALARALSDLGEHFEAVQILAAYEDDRRKTRFNFCGSGLVFARMKMGEIFCDMAEQSVSESIESSGLEE